MSIQIGEYTPTPYKVDSISLNWRQNATVGEASVNRQIYRPIEVSVDTLVDTPPIYRPILDRVSTNVSTDALVDTSVEAPHKIHDPLKLGKILNFQNRALILRKTLQG